MMNGKPGVPRAVVRRMVQYLAYLEEIFEAGAEWVSSRDMAEALDLTSATVRRDLAHLDFSGLANRGYEVEGLRDRLTVFLGMDGEWNVAIVGAGNLGKAVAMHGEWRRRGFSIRAVFDIDRRKIGTRVGDLVIRPLDELPATVTTDDIAIGVLAVPAPAAQAAADFLIAAGVRGILNLALTHIVAPARVRVTDARLAANMIELAHGIRTTAPPAGVKG